jgi:hypothetical protein
MKTFLFVIFYALLFFSLSACYMETDYTDSNTSDVSETNTDSAVSTEARKDNATIMDSGFSAGNGTQTNPYMITTPEELVHFSEEINNGKLNNGVYFALGADIDMSGVDFSPIGNSSHPFISHFDGRGHTVSNISPKLIYDDFGNNAIYS